MQNHLAAIDKTFFKHWSTIVQRASDNRDRLEGMRGLVILMSKLQRAQEVRWCLIHLESSTFLISQVGNPDTISVAVKAAMEMAAASTGTDGCKTLLHLHFQPSDDPDEKTYHQTLAELAAATKSMNKRLLICAKDQDDALKTYLHVTGAVNSIGDVDASEIRQDEPVKPTFPVKQETQASTTIAMKKMASSRARKGSQYDLVVLQEDDRSCLPHAVSPLMLGTTTLVFEHGIGANSLCTWLRQKGFIARRAEDGVGSE